jgi:hypothetical protein
MRSSMGCIAIGMLILLASMPAEAYVLRGGVLASGGTGAAGVSGSGRILYGTIGQSAVGGSAGSGHGACLGYWCCGGARVIAVDDSQVSDLPRELSFARPLPNPTTGEVELLVALPQAAAVHLRVYDVLGREVRTLASGGLPAGYHRLRWDGRDARGAARRSGIYFARLVVDGRPFAVQRVVFVR